MESLTGESLIKLIDDPDPMIFEAVSLKIKQLGPGMIPELESAAKQAMTPVLHERIENMIRNLQYDQLKTDFLSWINSPVPRLLDGAWLMLRYQFPEMTRQQFSLLIKPLRDEIWLEISDILTAIEKIRIMDTLIFSKNKVHLNEGHPDSPGNNYLNRVIETGKANEHSLNLLYAVLAQELGMPVFVVRMPDYPILAYIDMLLSLEDNPDPGFYDVLFYINPVDHGSLHSRNDITNFLIRHSLPLDPGFYEPRTNPEFIKICLKRLAADYELSASEFHSSQIQDLLTLWK